MEPKVYIVTGVNGVGKSSIIPELISMLEGEAFEIHDFDERGVPDSAGSEWRKSETKHWLQLAKINAQKGVRTVVCGFMKAEDIVFALGEVPGVSVQVCVLDIAPEVLILRIHGRYTTSESLDTLERTTGKTVEKFIADNVWVSTKFREAATQYGYAVVDTSALSPKLVAEHVARWILNSSAQSDTYQ